MYFSRGRIRHLQNNSGVGDDVARSFLEALFLTWTNETNPSSPILYVEISPFGTRKTKTPKVK